MAFGGTVRINPMGLTVLCFIAFIVVYVNLPPNSVNTPSSASSASTKLVNLKELLAACIEAAERGGKEVRKIRETVRHSFYGLFNKKRLIFNAFTLQILHFMDLFKYYLLNVRRIRPIQKI